MGNTNCRASGGCPHRADVTIANNTKYDLHLDTSIPCGRECQHTGWQITDGKIVEEFEPPTLIKSYDFATFSVSGRDSTAVAPKGKVFYGNTEKDISIICEWNACGWTSMSTSTASVTICGSKKSGLMSKETPWNQLLVGEATAGPWKYEIRHKEGNVSEGVKQISKLSNLKLNV